MDARIVAYNEDGAYTVGHIQWDVSGKWSASSSDEKITKLIQSVKQKGSAPMRSSLTTDDAIYELVHDVKPTDEEFWKAITDYLNLHGHVSVFWDS